MQTFNRRVVPIIVILNFIFSFQIFSQLRYLFAFRELDYHGWAALIIGLLLIIVINFIVIAITKKRYGDKFSISGYIIFVIIIPIISPVIMYCFVVFIGKILNISGVGFNMV